DVFELPQPVAAHCRASAAAANVSHERGFIRLLLLGAPAERQGKSPYNDTPTWGTAVKACQCAAVSAQVFFWGGEARRTRLWSAPIPGLLTYIHAHSPPATAGPVDPRPKTRVSVALAFSMER